MIADSGPSQVQPARKAAPACWSGLIGREHADGKQQAERVDEDVAFAPLHSLIAVKAAYTAAASRLCGLRIHDGDRGPWATPCSHAGLLVCRIRRRRDKTPERRHRRK